MDEGDDESTTESELKYSKKGVKSATTTQSHEFLTEPPEKVGVSRYLKPNTWDVRNRQTHCRKQEMHLHTNV